MDKVICDICGTVFPDGADKCPLCGCSKDFLLEDFDSVPMSDDISDFAEAGISGSRKKTKVFDFDEVNQEKPARRVKAEDVRDEEYEEDEDDEDEDDEPRTNVFLVVILVILIVLLLLASGFFFLRYFLPNMKDEPARTEAVQTEPVATTVVIEEVPAETEDLGIPCANLMMDGGKMELGKDGRKLLNVHVYPENTTDTVVYASSDEAVVTVSEDGTVTAVGEGAAVITVTCGDQQIKCNVTVDYDATEVTVSNDPIPAPTVENKDGTQATDATEAVDATEPAQVTEATEAAEETVPAGTELKLKKTDITISSNYTSVRLELDCEIKPEDVKWFTMDSTIAIVHDGVVTSTGSGMTRVYGEYEGQQVMCIVRCVF